MPAQPSNVRIVTNDREVRSGTTKSSEVRLVLTNVTLTSEDLDRLAAAISERLVAAPVEPTTVTSAASQADYVPVRRNRETRPMSEY